MANIMEIHDFSTPELDIYARWTENQLLNRKDPENAMFIAESQDMSLYPALLRKNMWRGRLLTYWLSAGIFRCIQLNLMC